MEHHARSVSWQRHYSRAAVSVALFTLVVLTGACENDVDLGQTASPTVLEPPKPTSCLIYAVGDIPGESQFLSAELQLAAGNVVGPTDPTDRLKGVDGIAIHPTTRVLFAVAGKDGGKPTNGAAASLFQIDAQTGRPVKVGGVGFSSVHGLSFRATDATLWTWVSSTGLVKLDTATGQGQLVLPSKKHVVALAWADDGKSLYLAESESTAQTKLWAYQPPSASLIEQSGELPGDMTALHVRPDGLLLGLVGAPQAIGSGQGNGSKAGPTAMHLFLHDPAKGQSVATFDVPTDQIAPTKLSPSTEFTRFTGMAWSNACGNPSAGGQATIIQAIHLDKTQLCPGESVLVQVDAVHPENPAGHVDITIDSLTGGTRYVHFPAVPAGTFIPGTRTITIVATTPEGHIDLQHAEVNLVSCPTVVVNPKVVVLPNRFHESTADFTVTGNVPALSFLGLTKYLWEFGDGTTTLTTVPTVSHSYADSLPTDEQYAVFQARVTIMRPGLPDLVTPKTVTVTNLYALSKLLGRIQPPVRNVSPLAQSGGALVGQFTVKNLENIPLTFTHRRLRYRYCDVDHDPKLLDPEPVSITIGAHAELLQSLALAAVPTDVCGVAVHLSGQSDKLPIVASAYLDIPDRAPRQVVQNPGLVAALNELRATGLLPNPDRVTDEDLFQLVRERKLSEFDIAQPPPGAPLSGATSSAAGVGEECQPGDVPPGPNLSCVPSGEWSEPQALIENAEKGDIVLVASCSTVGGLLRNVTPRQRYTHEALMTRNFVELSHSTATEGRIEDVAENRVGFKGSDGVKTDVIKYAWPGVLHQSVQEAFLGQTLTDPDCRNFNVDAFSANPVKCPGDQDVSYPIVLRPPLDASPDVRAKLYVAADVARGLSGHYRFYGFTSAEIAFDPAFDHERKTTCAPPAPPVLEPATVSSQFIWWALKKSGLTLEGPNLEDKDKKPTGLHLGGALVDSNTQDGLYFYTETERKNAAQWLFNFVFNKVKGIGGTFGDFFLGAPLNWANQAVNCFAWDFCGPGDTGVFCAQKPLDTCCDTSSDAYHQCDADFDPLWKEPGIGRAVSPDNFLFWDQPAGTLGAEPGEDGVYGSFERMIYRDGGRVPLYRWTPTQGFGAVQGSVLTQGEKACLTDAECPAGDVCHEKSCKHPCTQDTDCPSGWGCYQTNGFCARSVAGATVVFEQAAPDTKRQTGPDGQFAPYENVPVGDAASVITARLVTDPDPLKLGDETVMLGKEGFVLLDQTITEVFIFLRPTDPSLRLVTMNGLAHMIDCDCDGANEKGTRKFSVSCSVNTTENTQTFSVSPTNMCVDEVGIRIEGQCELLPGPSAENRVVRVSGSVKFYEGVEDSCGGDELEDSFSFSADIPPAEVHPPGTPFSLNMENGLKHEDVCTYAFYVVDCDDEAWGTGASTAVNDIQF